MFTSGGMQLIDRIEMTLGFQNDSIKIYIDVWDHNLSHKWLNALNQLLTHDYHLEKNYCFVGWADSSRDAEYIIQQINRSVDHINQAGLGYVIQDKFDLSNCIVPGVIKYDSDAGRVCHEKFNMLHRCFEELQGTSGLLSQYYQQADAETRWHIRQLNLCCHEFESLMLSVRKKILDPKWQRPSQLMCWLNAPRFLLDEKDHEMFGIDSINRPLGGVYVGVNKSVNKHHWEVFVDEAKYDPDFMTDSMTTTVLQGQTEAAGDFDIEWANDPREYEFQKKHLRDFRTWLINNGFDPEDRSLTIGHPQVAQVDLLRSFGTDNYKHIWNMLDTKLNVLSLKTSECHATFDYDWRDSNYSDCQIAILAKGK